MTGLVAMVKGFKVDVEVLDAFLDENGLWETFGTRPLPEQAEEITQLFKAKGVQGDVKVFVPHQIGYNNPNYMLVCFDWMLVYAIREFDSGSLQKNMPPGLKEIKTMLKADSNEVRTWVIFNDEEWPWTPELIVQRHTPPIPCGACDVTFDLWDHRMDHRRDVHLLQEDRYPLPEV